MVHLLAHPFARVTLLIAGAVLTPAPSAIAQHTVAADRFVDSVGVNIHLHYDNTAYRDRFPLIKSRLLELGVRHVRDGLIDTQWQPYFARHNELGDVGIKGTFITSPEQSTEVWAAYPARMPKTFEAYEAPNEYDMSSKPDWVHILTETLKRLRSLKYDPRAASFPLYGPSLTSPASYAALGDVSAYFDTANLHNYLAGRHPSTPGWGQNGYGSIPWNVNLAKEYAPGKPIVATETGYQDTPGLTNSVPREVAGRYLPILLLEQFRAGIERTFVYELCDFAKSGSYGLLTQDGSPKPGFTGIKSLLNLLADRGPAFTPINLPYTVHSDRDDARHMAFQKRNGPYFVALWRTRPSYDPTTSESIHVPPERVELKVRTTMRHVRAHHWQNDGSLSTTPWSTLGETIPVNVADRLVVIEVAPTRLSAPRNLRQVTASGQGSR